VETPVIQTMRQPACAQVLVHPSQSPEAVRRALLDSLRTRRVNHKFHYDSYKQTAKWLALHQAYSPSRTDPDCEAIYDRSFGRAAASIAGSFVHLVGLGCGGGQKDTRLLKQLQLAGKRVAYTPLDVSTAMVLVAREAALAVVSEEECFPLVCDLALADDLGALLEAQTPTDATRLVTFFGMIPNFEPSLILPRLAGLIRVGDALLLSANLAPGPDYHQGIGRILPLYDNLLTRDWLGTFLWDLGFEPRDGRLGFGIEPDPSGGPLQRVSATFDCEHARTLAVEGERFEFLPGDRIGLFFSYRYTPELLRSHLERHTLTVGEEWITHSGEEGVFLAHKPGIDET
jgi:L-histidine Nalpha-methyltransferase